MELAPPRGTLDLLPPEGSRMRALYDRAAEVARRYGYRYVETPGFEATELFSATSGQTSDVVSKEMYSFVDRGDRAVTLRPEGTAPVMRAYLHRRQQLPTPFKQAWTSCVSVVWFQELKKSACMDMPFDRWNPASDDRR